MLIHGRDHYHQRIFKPQTILYMKIRSPIEIVLETKKHSPRIVCHSRYVPDVHIRPDCKDSITDPYNIVRSYKALDMDSKSK